MNGKMQKIRIFPRLHISLISMTDKSYRYNGGIGFTSNSPTHELKFISSYSLNIKSNTINTSPLELQLQRAKEKLGFSKSIDIRIPKSIVPHHGFWFRYSSSPCLSRSFIYCKQQRV